MAYKNILKISLIIAAFLLFTFFSLLPLLFLYYSVYDGLSNSVLWFICADLILIFGCIVLVIKYKFVTKISIISLVVLTAAGFGIYWTALYFGQNEFPSFAGLNPNVRFNQNAQIYYDAVKTLEKADCNEKFCCIDSYKFTILYNRADKRALKRLGADCFYRDTNYSFWKCYDPYCSTGSGYVYSPNNSISTSSYKQIEKLKDGWYFFTK